MWDYYKSGESDFLGEVRAKFILSTSVFKIMLKACLILLIIAFFSFYPRFLSIWLTQTWMVVSSGIPCRPMTIRLIPWVPWHPYRVLLHFARIMVAMHLVSDANINALRAQVAILRGPHFTVGSASDSVLRQFRLSACLLLIPFSAFLMPSTSRTLTFSLHPTLSPFTQLSPPPLPLPTLLPPRLTPWYLLKVPW